MTLPETNNLEANAFIPQIQEDTIYSVTLYFEVMI